MIYLSRYNGLCNDCENYLHNLGLDNSQLPTLHHHMKTEGCFDCTDNLDLDLPEEPEEFLAYVGRECIEYSHSTTCDFNNEEFSSCIKRLRMLGRPEGSPGWAVTSEECHLLAQSDEDCGNTYFMGSDQYCYCWRQEDCCGSCLVGLSGQPFDIYELDPGEPNPTCEGGVLSTNGNLCCSEDCVDGAGVNRCGDEGVSNYDGTSPACGAEAGLGAMCCETDLHKNCQDTGFPCYMDG